MENLSGPPYVFTASKITLKDMKHPDGIVLSDVNVIFMHAGSNGSGPWVFSSFTDGYPVVETVNKTNEYLNRNGEPPVQVVLACNHRTADEMNIKVGDFPPNSGIVYAVGETVILNSAFMDIGGKVVVMASADQFWGIEEAQLSQQIQIL